MKTLPATFACTAAALAALGLALSLGACQTPDASGAILANEYPPVVDGGDPSTEMTIYKAWYAVSYFADPIAPGQDSQANRMVPVDDYVYLLLAPGWDPSSSVLPTKLIAVETITTHPITRGEVVRVPIRPETIKGNCAAGSPLSQAEADFLTTQIFPEDFAGSHYDAATCTATLPPADAGADGARVGDAAGEGG
jgi:hypothetical protein